MFEGRLIIKKEKLGKGYEAQRHTIDLIKFIHSRDVLHNADMKSLAIELLNYTIPPTARLKFQPHSARDFISSLYMI